MHLVQDSAAAHRHLSLQKRVVEQSDHRTAKQQVLLDLVRNRPGYLGLVRKNILSGQGGHVGAAIDALMATDQRGSTGAEVDSAPTLRGTVRRWPGSRA